MRLIRSSKIRYLLAVLLFCLSCGQFDELKSPIDGFKLMINYDIFNTFLSFRFIDAATGKGIGSANDEKVNLKFSGDGAGAVVDQLGNHETSYQSVYGLLSLALNPKDPWIPSAENLIKLNLEAESSKYKTVKLELKLDSIGKYQYDIRMERTDVDQQGFKAYFFELELDEEGRLIDDFEYSSSGGEGSIRLKAGTQFKKLNGDIEKTSPANLIFKVYTSLAAVPSNALLSDITLPDGSVTKSALDLYRAIDIQLRNQTAETLAEAVNHSVGIQYQIGKTAYNPVTMKAILPGDELNTYTYLSGNKSWQHDRKTKLESNADGYFVNAETSSLALHAAGMHIGLCPLEGQINFSLEGDFPVYPVPAIIYFYRKTDNRYISNTKADIPANDFVKLLNAAVPEKTPVRIYVVNASSNNSFTVKPPNFYHEPGCGNFGNLKTLLTSTSVAVSGKVSLSMTGDFPDPEFGVTAGIYSQSSNALLWSKVYTISKSKSEFDVAANLPAGTQAYLKIQAVKSQNSFENEAISQEFNTTSAQNMNWSFSIKPKFKRVVLNFSFTRSAQLPAGDYPVKIEFTNTLNGNPKGNLVFQVKSNQTE